MGEGGLWAPKSPPPPNLRGPWGPKNEIRNSSWNWTFLKKVTKNSWNLHFPAGIAIFAILSRGQKKEKLAPRGPRDELPCKDAGNRSVFLQTFLRKVTLLRKVAPAGREFVANCKILEKVLRSFRETKKCRIPAAFRIRIAKVAPNLREGR